MLSSSGERSKSLRFGVIKDLTIVSSSIWKDEANRHVQTRQLLVFLGWQVWKRTIAKPVIVELFNGYRFIAYPDCRISSRIIYSRIPDCREITFLRQHLSGGTFVDVGSNVCLYPLLLADRIDHAVLFDPNPIAARRARENIAINRLPYEVYEMAVSDRGGEIQVEDRGGVDTCNQTLPEGSRTNFPTRAVSSTTLDQFLERNGSSFPPIKGIKIDVEGYENFVLRGMKGCLETIRPELVMFEYLQRTNIKETISFFTSVNYGVFCLTPRGLAPAHEEVADCQNLFAFPQESNLALRAKEIS